MLERLQWAEWSLDYKASIYSCLCVSTRTAQETLLSVAIRDHRLGGTENTVPTVLLLRHSDPQNTFILLPFMGRCLATDVYECVKL
jgi:hypothetical protein